MTPERAYEILRLDARWSTYRKHMTAEEIAFVIEGWRRMPESTSFYDALARVAREQEPFGPRIAV